MEKTVEISEIYRTIGDVIRDVAAKGDQVIVEDGGRPVAVVVPVEFYHLLRQSRKEAGNMLREMATRADMDPDEADQLAAEAVAWAHSHKEV